MTVKGSRLKRAGRPSGRPTFQVMSGRKRLGLVTSKKEFNRLLKGMDKSKNKIKLKAK